MIEIKDLLGYWSDRILSEEIKMESLRSIISETIGIPIKKEDLRIKNNTIFLNAKPIYKNEIFIKKEIILSKLEKTFGKITPYDIR
jgi:hypothetical protein